jgi:hypothetical protein
MPATGNASETRYGGCEQEAEVVYYSIVGQGHAWAGDPALPLLGDSVSDVNASVVLREFFRGALLNPAGWRRTRGRRRGRDLFVKDITNTRLVFGACRWR